MRLLLLLLLVAACGEDAAPAFPADYAGSYVEVRNCRRSGDHDLHFIRVLADEAAAGPYANRDADFPQGSIVLKEEYDFADDACEGAIVEWTVMERAGDDWRWQKVAPDRSVTSEDDSRCIGCHQMCGVSPDGYQGTCAVP